MHFRCSYETDVKAWYDFGVLDEGRGLVLRVEKGAADRLFDLLSDKIANRFVHGIKIPTFIKPGVLPWGYGPNVIVEEEEGLWVRIECDLPALFSDINHETYTGEERWDRAFGLSATWMLLMTCLWQIGSDYVSPLNEPQLVEVELGLLRERGLHSCPIEAGLSLDVLAWLGKQGEEQRHCVMSRCMVNAFHRLRAFDMSDPWMTYRTYTTIRQPARIDFSCEGEACGLNPAHNYGYTLNRGKGYDLYPHNVDNPMQQMVLLVGLAELSSLVRKEMI